MNLISEERCGWLGALALTIDCPRSGQIFQTWTWTWPSFFLLTQNEYCIYYCINYPSNVAIESSEINLSHLKNHKCELHEELICHRAA